MTLYEELLERCHGDVDLLEALLHRSVPLAVLFDEALFELTYFPEELGFDGE